MIHSIPMISWMRVLHHLAMPKFLLVFQPQLWMNWTRPLEVTLIHWNSEYVAFQLVCFKKMESNLLLLPSGEIVCTYLMSAPKLKLPFNDLACNLPWIAQTQAAVRAAQVTPNRWALPLLLQPHQLPTSALTESLYLFCSNCKHLPEAGSSKRKSAIQSRRSRSTVRYIDSALVVSPFTRFSFLLDFVGLLHVFSFQLPSHS